MKELKYSSIKNDYISITTSLRFKCVPTFRGSLSIQNEMYDNFLLFIAEKRTVVLIPIIFL